MTAPSKPAREHARAGLRFLTGIPGLPIRPRRTKAQRDALHALAETPGLTPDQYEREKAEILRGATT